MGLALRGESAEVRWSYHVAALLGAWTLTVDRANGTTPRRREFRARVQTVQPWAIRQRPLTLVVVRPGQVWAWPILRCTLEDDTFVAELGAKEGDAHVTLRSA